MADDLQARVKELEAENAAINPWLLSGRPSPRLSLGALVEDRRARFDRSTSHALP